MHISNVCKMNYKRKKSSKLKEELSWTKEILFWQLPTIFYGSRMVPGKQGSPLPLTKGMCHIEQKRMRTYKDGPNLSGGRQIISGGHHMINWCRQIRYFSYLVSGKEDPLDHPYVIFINFNN